MWLLAVWYPRQIHQHVTTGRVIPKEDVSTCDYWPCDTQGRCINLWLLAVWYPRHMYQSVNTGRVVPKADVSTCDYWPCNIISITASARFVFTSSCLFMSYLRYLCLFVYSGLQPISCWVFVLFFFVLCTLCCQFLWIIYLWFPVRYSPTFSLCHEDYT
jgi:hypothetical protein